MFNSLRQYISAATLFQLGAEMLSMFVVVLIVLHIGGEQGITQSDTVLAALLFALTMICLNGAFGVYQRGQPVQARVYLLRVVLAPAIGIPLAMLVVALVPGVDVAGNKWIVAIVAALAALLIVRHLVVLPLVAALLPHRVLVLGTGPEARMVEASVALGNPLGFRLVGFYPLEKAQEASVPASRVIAKGSSLEDTARRLGVNEIIVAVRQQRGGVLPLRGLLDCRLAGVRITDLAGFFERVHGQVPIDSLKISWLIYGHGFRQNAMRAIVKRTLDVVASAVLCVIALPLVGIAALAIALEGGGPVIYRQQRVGLRGRVFTVFKLRSMTQDAECEGSPRWATKNDPRVTPVGRLIRRTRIDELPQLWNVLKGEMSFVGPRPERPEFVSMLVEQIPFYAARHSVKPGLTGWAQVRYSYGATVEQSIRKLEYDLYYVKNHTLLLDLGILLETVRVVLLGEGAR
ncbi:MAG TPA: TIGR03013 family XrtA/PEP-CTERM system glycosyltransferase [Burkholderiales bacterium]|nr:TIGR03013 family XrtA/PEP-CTERM system glycosyltransferase [Burkholderiales bacterium]